MASIGMNFRFYNSETIGGKYKWTALMGLAKKRVLEKFPVTSYLPGSRGHTIEKLWQNFFSLYKLMCSKDELADATINKFEIDAQNCVFTFCQPTLKKATKEIIQKGIYQRQDVTPYMHILACHIPAFMRSLKSEDLKLQYFSSSSLEKKSSTWLWGNWAYPIYNWA
ncbi:hypothetical protein C2G38_2042811 [Gigaspora rosea]|uniref:Uncharacterized protein n=1 Tax=Gigaspora rosea TaxID=44941 RepID=A0A397UM84_9GLOM|nr:hypothetical protein C2G38_2042811 [Gigaspora rosea]